MDKESIEPTKPQLLAPGSKYSPLITVAVEFLRTVVPGAEVSYQEIGGAVGLPVQSGPGYQIVHMARTRLKKEGVLLRVLKGRGFRRLTKGEVVAQGETSGLQRVDNAAKRALNEIRTVHPLDPELTPHQRTTAVSLNQTLGLVRHQVSPSEFKKVKEIAAKTPSFAELLEGFKKFSE